VVLFAVAVLLRFSPSASTPLSFAVVAVAVVAVVAVAARFWRESPLSVV